MEDLKVLQELNDMYDDVFIGVSALFERTGEMTFWGDGDYQLGEYPQKFADFLSVLNDFHLKVQKGIQELQDEQELQEWWDSLE